MSFPTARGLLAILIGGVITVGLVGGIPAVGSTAPGDDLEVTPLGVVNDVYSTPCVIGDQMLFVANGNDELWTTDGTIENTSLIKALNGYTNLGCAVLDRRLSFTVSEVGGLSDKTQLWMTDGTSGGTFMIRDFGPDSRIGDSSLGGLGPRVAGVLLFVVSEPVRGTELWVTNGTAAGTQSIATLSSAIEEIKIEQWTTFGDRVAFVLDGELWVSDGTSAGTKLAPGFGFDPGISEPDTVTPFGDRVLFNGRRRGETGIWMTDGNTTWGPLTIDGRLGAGRLIGGRFVFNSSTPDRGAEVWVTDGTVAGTQLLANISASGLEVLGDRLVLSADEGLWVTDGTVAGTQLLANISATSFELLGDRLVFRAASGVPGTWELWVTDGTVRGTRMITEIESVSPDELIVVGDYVVFGGHRCCVDPGEVWVSDLTPSGTRRLLEIHPAVKPRVFGAQYPIYSFEFTRLENRVVFGAMDRAADTDQVVWVNSGVWVTDGTLEGTGLVAEIAGLAEFRAIGDKVIFIAGARGTHLAEELHTVARNPEAAVDVADYSDAPNLASLINADNYLDEFDAPVLRLYQAYFDRDPDLAGAKYWLDVRRMGYDTLDIAGFMAGSNEFANTYAGTTNAEFVERVYENVLGRFYDQAGYDYWLDLLDTGRLDRAGTVYWTTQGQEFINKYPYTK